MSDILFQAGKCVLCKVVYIKNNKNKHVCNQNKYIDENGKYKINIINSIALIIVIIRAREF